MSRLSKRDVERLLDCYDDDPVEALDEAIDAISPEVTDRPDLSSMTVAERDALLRDLVEWRGLTPPEL